jgi:predicted transposase/invertase (TIGR01784 family)
MHQLNDKGYKWLFKNKTIFRQLLETFVSLDWVKELDFDTCERLDKSFISDHYKETASDIIYKIRLKQKEIYIVILVEFKSKVERFTSLRILNYITNFWMDYVESTPKARMLPPVFPILLYNGDAKWTAPVTITELVDGHEYLGRYAVNFEYFKIAENAYPKRVLLKIKNIVSTLFLAEAHYNVDLLVKELLALFEQEEDKAAISLLINWFAQLRRHERIPEKDYNKLERVYANKQEAQQMLITAVRKEKQSFFDKGKREGKREGRVQVARKMLAKGFAVALIAEVTGLSAEKIVKLKPMMMEQ